jgi:hypothetical protein
MKRIHLALILPCVLLGVPAIAQQTTIMPQIQGEVAYVSGGVGGDEREAMKAMRADYNLSLLFSVKGSGEYISDAKVCIKDASGAVRLETVSDGPMLYAKLKPGRYSISADRDGHVMENKVTLSGKKLTALSFAWPAEEGD